MTVTTTHTRPSELLEPQTLLDMLHRMMVIRRVEERTSQAYQQTKIGGFCHIYIGQEAAAVGTTWAMRQTDPLITAYRDHGHALARDMDPNILMAEMYGKMAGCAKGKGGSMHMFDKPNHMYGGHAIVGGQCPLAVGLGWGIQYNQQDHVCVCFLGDGALNQGAFHESMNLAAIFNLPVIFLLENNLYSMGTHIARGTAIADDLSVKAESYGMRYAECDGMDAIDVYDVLSNEISRTRNAKNPQSVRNPELSYDRQGREPGPAFINCKTYRYKGHSMSDPQKYRTKEEVHETEEQYDPIKRLRNYLVTQGIATDDRCEELDESAKQIAVDATKYADQAEPTPLDELFTDVYSEPYGEPYKKGDVPPFMKEAADHASNNGSES